MPLTPCSTQAIDFADSSIFFKSSAERRSGLGAPFLDGDRYTRSRERSPRGELTLLNQVVGDLVGDDGDIKHRTFLDLNL